MKTTYYIVTGIYLWDGSLFKYTRPFLVNPAAAEYVWLTEERLQSLLSNYRFHTYIIKSTLTSADK